MTSVDTNVLLYALNADAPEHTAARAFLDEHRQNPEFVLCELVLVELYVLLRNPAVLAAPLGAEEAVAVIQRFRSHPAWQLIDHDPQVMDDVWRAAGERGFARTRIFDVRLAYTLLRHGVTRFATRNVKHFEGLGFPSVWDPLSK
jgi:toxin-antitoxin system PIN domain toxin